MPNRTHRVLAALSALALVRWRRGREWRADSTALFRRSSGGLLLLAEHALGVVAAVAPTAFSVWRDLNVARLGALAARVASAVAVGA